MTAFDNFLDLVSEEIIYWGEIKPPLRERIYCWLFRLKPRHETIKEELGWMYREGFYAVLKMENIEKNTNRKELLEALARHSHSEWMEWSKAIAENECLSPARLKRWQGDLWKPYDQLSEDQKEQDRIRAREILAIVEDFQRAAAQPQVGKGWDP